MGGAMMIEAVLLVNYVMVFTWNSSKCPSILASNNSQFTIHMRAHVSYWMLCNITWQNLKLYTLDGNKWYQN